MRRGFIVLFAFMLAVLPLSAQEIEDHPDILAEQIAKLEERSTLLEKIKLSGFIQGVYMLDNAGTSTFSLYRARLFVSGNIFEGPKGAKTDYRIQAEFAGTPRLIDLWIRYRPHKAFGVQFGQFKMPLLIEFAENYELEVIDYALSVQRLQRVGLGDVTGISAMGRDIGLQFYGDMIQNNGVSLLSYNLAILNGNGVNTRDNNSSKDVIARLMLRPVKQLLLSGFYQWGEANFTESPLKENFGQAADSRYMALRRYGGSIYYTGKRLSARAEYIKGATGDLHSEGAYLLAKYAFHEKSSVAARIDYFDEDVYTRPNELHYVVGLNYKPWPMLLLQLNYTHKQYKYSEHGNINMVSAMATVRF